MTNFKNTIALVTGGGSGIGRALSLELALRGSKVHVTDLNSEASKSVAAECGDSASFECLDVCNAEAVKKCVNDLYKKNGRIDFIFNNAGIGGGGEVYDIPLEVWDKVIDINIRGVINGVHAAYSIMVKQGHGHIVNTASAAGLTPIPLLTPYVMSKHAVVGLSTSLRAEAAPFGVKVSVLCPGAIETPLLDQKQLPGLPEMPWVPDSRRYLTNLAGTPYPVEKLAKEALDAIAKNKGTIVIPKKAKILWLVARLFPGLVENENIKSAINERKHRT